MVLHFNVKGESRKAMVRAIEEELGMKATYLKVPSCAYRVGNYTVGKNGELSFEASETLEESSVVIDACVMATGTSPEEWDNNIEKEKIKPQGEDLGLTVAIPKDKVDLEKLEALLDAKGELIQKALGAKNLEYEEGAYEVRFPWLEEVQPDETMTYTRFISALCEMTMKQKRISAKQKEVDNEKYAFRCFLLRLGFIGEEYKTDRKILLKNLSGSSAFKNGAKKGAENDEISK